MFLLANVLAVGVGSAMEVSVGSVRVADSVRPRGSARFANSGGRVAAVRRFGVAALAAVILLGACTLPGSGTQKPVLVTASHKEKLGYEQPEGMRNPGAQRTALAHREEIYAVVKPYVERELGGRKVVLGDISAPYPYAAVEVSYRTVDEPVVASYVMVNISDIDHLTEGYIDRIEPGTIEGETLSGLFLMAYRPELTKISDHLEAAYPGYVAQPEGYARTVEQADPRFSLEFDTMSQDRTVEDVAEIIAAENRIYAAYEVNPNRTDAQWREVFQAGAEGLPLRIRITLMVKNPEKTPDEAMLARLKEDMMSSAAFADYAAFDIFLDSNLRSRDGITVHETFWSWYDATRSRWHDDHKIDGWDVDS